MGYSNTTVHDFCHSNDETMEEQSKHLEVYDACKIGDTAYIRRLLSKSTERNSLIEAPLHQNHTSALYEACSRNQAEIVSLLLHYGIPANIGTVWGSTPLYIASQRGFINVTKLLLHNGAEVDKSGSDLVTPFMVAARWGRLEICQLLALYGANIEAKDAFGASVESTIIKSNSKVHKRVHKWLQHSKGYSRLHFACEMMLPNMVVHLLREDNPTFGVINVRQRGNNGFTPLSAASFAASNGKRFKDYKKVAHIMKEAMKPYGESNHNLFPGSFRSMVGVLCQLKRSVDNSRNKKHASLKNWQQLSTSLFKRIRRSRKSLSLPRKKRRSDVDSIEEHLENLQLSETEHAYDYYASLASLPKELIFLVLEYCDRDWFTS